MELGTGGMRLFNKKWLTIKGGSIGPEAGIGHYVGHSFDALVLLLNSGIGNQARGWDRLPPGNESPEFTDSKGSPGFTPVIRGTGTLGEWHQAEEDQLVRWQRYARTDCSIRAVFAEVGGRPL